MSILLKLAGASLALYMLSAPEFNAETGVPESFGPVLYVASSDTIRAGEVFIHNLPDSLNGQAIARYGATSLPLKSWLLGSSFFWNTSEQDIGDHAFTFYGFRAGAGAGEATVREATDSVTVHIVVR